jgi:flagellar basal-body rod protein FlgF
MDNSIYVALSGIQQAETLQTVVSHNLANVSTAGFRAELPLFDSSEILGDGLATRANTIEVTQDWDDRTGAIMRTGEPFDLAIHGEGWFAVQDAEGNEAYTRAGSFHLTPTGLLETRSGQLVLGNGGPISLPEFQEVYVGSDGRVSIVPIGQKANTLVEVDRLKLVNPTKAELERGADGLFRPVSGEAFAADPSVQVGNGELESSNVNVSEMLVRMIELQRHFENQVRALRVAEENDSAAASVMQMTA